MTAFGVLSLSFVLHGVAFAAAFGHGSSNGARAGDVVQTLDIEAPVEETVEIKAPEIEPENEKAPPTPEQQTAALPTHTHDYPVAPSHDMTPHDPNLVHVPLAHDDDPDHKSHDKTSDPEPAPAAAPAIAAAPASVPHFTMNASGGIGLGGGMVATNGAGTGLGDGARGGTGDGSFGAGEPASESQVDEPARVSFAPAPRYPAAAQEDGIEAEVPVEIVIDSTGAVRSARALGRVGHGLDEAAVSGVRAYRFTPAKRQGRATAVRMKWVVEFRLR